MSRKRPAKPLRTQPEALLVTDTSGTYYAGELLTDFQVAQLYKTHKISRINF